MYTAWYSDSMMYPHAECFYDSTSDDLDFQLIDPILELEKNAAGSFEFTISQNHSCYDKITRLTTLITIARDDKIIWQGRPMAENVNFYNQKQFSCEGCMAFFNDTVQPYKKYVNTPFLTVFRDIIDRHNSMVDQAVENDSVNASYKKFRKGSIEYDENSMIDSNGKKFSETEFVVNYETTMEILNKFVETYGGWLLVSFNENGEKVINYLKSYSKTARQSIEFGMNLLDYTVGYEMEEFCTAVIPLGREINDDGEKRTCAYANNGHTVIYNPEVVKRFGWIYKVLDCSDVNLEKEEELSPDQIDLQEGIILKQRAEKYLEDIQFENMTLELSAYDLGIEQARKDWNPPPPGTRPTEGSE